MEHLHSRRITDRLPRLDELLRHAWALCPTQTAAAEKKLVRLRQEILVLHAELQQERVRAKQSGSKHDAALVETLLQRIDAVLAVKQAAARGGGGIDEIDLT